MSDQSQICEGSSSPETEAPLQVRNKTQDALQSPDLTAPAIRCNKSFDGDPILSSQTLGRTTSSMAAVAPGKRRSQPQRILEPHFVHIKRTETGKLSLSRLTWSLELEPAFKRVFFQLKPWASISF
jgi:hypothetical protein